MTSREYVLDSLENTDPEVAKNIIQFLTEARELELDTKHTATTVYVHIMALLFDYMDIAVAEANSAEVLLLMDLVHQLKEELA